MKGGDFMQKQYVLVVHDEILTNRPLTDEVLKNLDCYYESPVFFSNETWQSMDKAIDKFYHHFKHFIKWSAKLVEVQ